MYVFAISPNSEMHIKHLQIALLNFICAKQEKKPFILRILNAQNMDYQEEKIQEIITVLDFFGLKFEHIYYQKDNIKFYLQFASKLLYDKKAFSCFCQSQECEQSCANLSDEEVLNNQKHFTIRIKKSKKDINFKDTLSEQFKFKPKDIGDFLIMSKEKYPSFDFANGIDDMIQNVNHIIKDSKCSLHVAKQLHVKTSLGYTQDIKVSFISSISNQTEKTKLISLLELGFLPEAIVSYILSQTFETKDDMLTLENTFDKLDISKITNPSTKFDMKKLKLINKKYIELQDDTKLASMLGYSSPKIGKLAKVLTKNASTLNEIKLKLEGIFGKKHIPNELKKECEQICLLITKTPQFEKFEDFMNFLLAQSELEEDKLYQVLYVLLTNSQKDMQLRDLYPIIKDYFKEITK
ncbi:MAG: hypothetical protein KGV58_00990 [Campylobacteraceae bacterium]|nr:hypothetical protein [Campylobacteraceae bacterium]